MARAVEFGVFMPVASNGFLFSRHAPQYHPTFELQRRIAELTENIGLDFLFWMGKWKGFGGATRFWDHSLEPIAVASAIAACTKRLKLIATINPLLFHPAVAAKVIATIDDVSGGRFGINVVTGNTLDEIEQMGVVPEGYAEWRYEYADEWIRVVKALWSSEQVTFEGRFFKLTNCVSDPKPHQKPAPFIVSAGTSDEGVRFGARHSDSMFVGGRPAVAAKVRQFAAEEGRKVTISTNAFILPRPTDFEGETELALLRENVDSEAAMNVRRSFDRDKRVSSEARMAYMKQPTTIGFISGAPIVGAPETVARKLVDMIEANDFDAVQFVFMDYVNDLAFFGCEVVPILRPMLAAKGIATNLGAGVGTRDFESIRA
jgi:pyrimidine oxygenase